MKFRWTFQASTDFLCRMSEDEVRLLGESGVSHMGFGTESTSEPVLKLMNKRHQRVDEMFETARKANIADIRVTFNLIFGYPGETEADRAITFRTMSEIARAIPQCQFLAQHLHTVSGHSNLAATARARRTRTEVAARMDADATGSQHAAVAAGQGTRDGCSACWSTSCSTARFITRGRRAFRYCVEVCGERCRHRLAGDCAAANTHFPGSCG